MIAAAHKSSGKTVISAGIAAALAAREGAVGVFKKGPDYIDPMWLHLAAGRPAYNLDFNTMEPGEILSRFASRAAGCAVNLIEANKGLYDGVCPDGSDSNAALAKLLSCPVVLVIDTRGMTRGIAPLLLGYTAFDPEVRVAGVILNRTGGTRHEGKLRQAVEMYTNLPVLGAVGNTPELDISERHLGLTTPAERRDTRGFLAGVAARLERSVDLDAIHTIARSAPQLPAVLPERPPALPGPRLRIGIARDEAFSFYYPDDLETFAAAGADLVPVDMLRDPALPPVDGLFIGGGFPETQMGALAANTAMRASLHAALEGGLPTYAECGGLMYLTRSITWKGETRPMVGFFDADTVVQDRPQGRGHVRFAATAAALWPAAGTEGRAHEFHYSRLENMSDPLFGRTVSRGHGIDGQHDALVRGNTQAGFIHLRHTTQTPWVTQFLRFVANVRAAKSPARKERGHA